MESTSDIYTSKAGKFRKTASHGGETERLKKKGREKHARGSARENERRRRFEENIRKKERMLKLDKKRSGVMDRGDGMSGVHGNTKDAKASEVRNGRWQMGDGFYVKRDTTSSISIKKTKPTCEKRERNKARSKKTKVSVPTSQRGERKERTREWVEQFHQSSERSSSDKLSAAPRVAGYPTHDLSGDPQDLPASWFIHRLGQDVEYTPIMRPFRDVSLALAPVSAPTAAVCVPDTQGTDDTHYVPRRSLVHKKRIGSRVVSVLRFFGRCWFGKNA